jgi:hypothetical protein
MKPWYHSVRTGTESDAILGARADPLMDMAMIVQLGGVLPRFFQLLDTSVFDAAHRGSLHMHFKFLRC